MAIPTRRLVVKTRAPEPDLVQQGAAYVYTERLYFQDFAAAALTGDKDLTSFPGLLLIEGAFFIFNTNFTGGAVATATLQIGTTATPNAYVAATSVFSGATVAAPVQAVGVTIVPGTFLNATTPLAAGTVRCRLTTTVANTNALTAGVVDIHLRLRAIVYRAK